MVRGGSGSYRLRTNESEIEAEIHTLRDGGLLMQASTWLESYIYEYTIEASSLLFKFCLDETCEN